MSGAPSRLEEAVASAAVGMFADNVGLRRRPSDYKSRAERDANDPFNLGAIGFCAIATLFALLILGSSYQSGNHLMTLASGAAVVVFPAFAFMAFRSSMIVSEFMDD